MRLIRAVTMTLHLTLKPNTLRLRTFNCLLPRKGTVYGHSERLLCTFVFQSNGFLICAVLAIRRVVL